MPRPKKVIPGKRYSLWLDGSSRMVADDIDNLSKFLQLALVMATDIMAYAILHEHDPVLYRINNKSKKVINEYNKKYPLDPLTAKRLGKNGTGTKRSDQNISQESNPTLR